MISSRYTPFLLLGIAVALTTLQLRLVWNTGQLKGLEPYVLCYATVYFMVWRKRNSLKLECASWRKFKPIAVANSVGFACILWVLYKSTSIYSYDSALRFLPIISGLGLVFIGFGFSGLKSCWRELVVLSFLLIPTTTLMELFVIPKAMEFFDISHATATLAGNFLWYSGFPVIQDGTKLVLPTGFVDVYAGCSGIQSILQLLTLAFLFTMLFPMGWLQTLLIAIAAIVIAFLVNGVRVALMAVLFAQANESAFDYWHLGDGSQLFSMVAVLLFGGVCYFCLERFDAEMDSQHTEHEGS